jgi:hypothetical protein
MKKTKKTDFVALKMVDLYDVKEYAKDLQKYHTNRMLEASHKSLFSHGVLIGQMKATKLFIDVVDSCLTANRTNIEKNKKAHGVFRVQKKKKH